ncbi:MAG TPA: family 16 glycosylhydrolase [Verrucomicrobiae bacterium]|nr:family 16 glycosylhydrolase [Verrucomicrobiae bacterium]
MRKQLTALFAVGKWATRLSVPSIILIGAGAVNAQVQLSIQPGVQLSWPTPNPANTYHLQWLSLSGGTWSDLVSPVAGNGTTHTNFDPFPSGSRLYQDLEIVPGTPPSPAAPANSGFETGSGSSADSWTVDTAAGGPVYGVRTNDSPHSGSFDFQIHLASTGAGPVVQFNQSGVPVTGGTVYPFTFYAKALAGSLGYNAQWRILWSPSGDTGYQTFGLTAGSAYALISNSVTAPASATSATIFFHFAGAADPGQSANIDIDDVTFGSGTSSPGTPDVTNVLQVTNLPVANVNWPSTSGVQYFPQILTDQISGVWSDSLPAVIGDGTTMSIMLPMTNSATFIRLRTPPPAVLPPTDLHQIPSGSSNAISIAWTPSTTPGVTGYRLLYGDISGTTTNTTDLGNVTSAVISGLSSGVTYFVSIVTLSPYGLSSPSDATIQAQVSNISNGVLWSDEFDGDVIDPSTWTYDVGGGGWGNGQFEYDSARHENSYVTNGTLVIEARRENWMGNQFTSARMLTQGRLAFKYGDLEARIKLPNTANGLWPAFWMMGNNAGAIVWPDCGELDITEMGSAAGITQGLQQELVDSAVHYSNATNGYSNYVTWYTAPVDLTQDYHRYKMSWTPTTITFYLDDVPIGSMDITADYLSEFHQPMFPILNIAVGGYNPSYTGVYSPADVTAPMPARMYVDWIRVSDNGYTQLYFGDDNAETGNFGVYTDTTPVNHSLTYGTGLEPGFEYGTNAALYTWNNMTAVAPTTTSEGANAWSFDVAGGDWFGMGVFLPNFRNMKNYSDGYLHFDLKTTSTVAMQVGVKSCRGGEFWLPVGDETAEFGFARDGQWHSLKIPLNRFANTDFRTMSQMFMISSVGNAPSALNLSIDNVRWEPSVARVTPENGNFGVYTETAANKTAGQFALGVQGNFFVWANTLVPITQHPYEGAEDISLQSAPGLTWFGMAFTPNVKYNLSAFRYPGCKLEFAMKTSSTATFMVGMKSGNIDGVGQKWITFQAGSDPYGFVRDGNWHVVDIPMSDFAPEVDLSAVSQFFEVLSTTSAISDIELDDIHFTNGGVASPPDQ